MVDIALCRSTTMMRRRFLTLPILLNTGCLARGAPLSSPVFVTPGANLSAIANANPEGCVFILQAGLYRMQSVTPKTGQQFIGDLSGTTLLNGSQVIPSGSFTLNGSVYVANNINVSATSSGVCQPGYRCDMPNDVYIDGVLLQHVTSAFSVVAGTFYLDYTTHTLTLGMNPAGHMVELSVVPCAFNGQQNANNVVVKNITIEKYACPAEVGAIEAGIEWTVENCEVRYNHGVGVNCAYAPGCRIRQCFLHHNGQEGYGGSACDRVLIEYCEIANNNTCGFDPTWEAGAGKITGSHRVVIRRNYVHNNLGRGIWGDVGNNQATYEGNTVDGNLYEGITEEIGSDAIIRNNLCRRNGGTGNSSQILLSNSSGCYVYDNIVETTVSGGTGIALVQDNRGGPLCQNNVITRNNVTWLGAGFGAACVFADYDPSQMTGNRWLANHYHVPTLSSTAFLWPNRSGGLSKITFTELQTTENQEMSGTIDTNIKALLGRK